MRWGAYRWGLAGGLNSGPVASKERLRRSWWSSLPAVALACPTVETGAPLRSLLLRDRPPYAAATVAGKWRPNGPEPYLAARLLGGACRPRRARRRVLGPSGAARRKSLGGGRREAGVDWRREGPGAYVLGGTARGQRVGQRTGNSFLLRKWAPTLLSPVFLLVLSLCEGVGSEFGGAPAQFDSPSGRGIQNPRLLRAKLATESMHVYGRRGGGVDQLLSFPLTCPPPPTSLF